MSNEKKGTILGNGKQTGDFINVAINLEKVEGLIVTRPKGSKELPPHLFENKDGDLFLKLTVCKRKEAGNYGETHFVKQDDFVKSKD